MNEAVPYKLLAKSAPEVTLKRHIEDCLDIYEQLKVCIVNIPLDDPLLYWKLLYTSIVFHDLGKAHSDFQKLLMKKRNSWYFQRHELFSLSFVNRLKYTAEEKRKVEFAVLGHHKSLKELFSFVDKNYESYEDEEESALSFLSECGKMDTDEVLRILDQFNYEITRDVSLPIYGIIRQYNKEKYNLKSKEFLFYLMLVGGLKQCDHLASAGIKKIQRLEASDFDFLYKFPLYTHQQKSADAIGNVILSSPTGSGKTETSLLWLKKQVATFGQGRVFYILPYTASINAMYMRLNEEMPSDPPKVGMVHGKLAQFLEYDLENEHSSMSADAKIKLLTEFKTLVTPIKITTPFQLLKHIFGVKGFEKGMFEWVGAYFIFDEIHAYDPITFAQIMVLLAFVIDNLNVRVFIMTATLPTFLRKRIETEVKSYSSIMADTDLYKSFTRHSVHLKDGMLIDSLVQIQNFLDEGKKVLVVCNTVEQAQLVYLQLNSLNKVLLHGSFNSEDRMKKEQALKLDSTYLLVGTQAIEVSLDIDFDILFTEPAPLDALIQRFGRINRKRKKGISPCFIFKERGEKDSFIYKDEEVISRTLAAIAKIEQEGNCVIREDKLQSIIDFVYPSWNEDSEDKFNNTKTLLSYALEYNLELLSNDIDREDDFYKQFDGVKVLPISKLEEYSDRLKRNEFIKAESLLVQIRKNRFCSMLKNQDIYKDNFTFESIKSSDETIRHSVFVIKRAYNGEVGLQMNIVDTVRNNQELML